MPRNIGIIITCALLTLISVSCAKKTPLTNAQKEYVGTWIAGSSHIVIKKDGSIDYKIVDGPNSTEVTGAGVTISKTSMGISFLGTKRTWKIDSEPKNVTGAWQMTIDSVAYRRK